MTECIAVMRGYRKLTTLKDVVDFWKFAVEQGKPHPEMRECIAILVVFLTNRPNLEQPGRIEPLHDAYAQWLYCQDLYTIWMDSWDEESSERTKEEHIDDVWGILEYYIDEIDIHKKLP